MESDRYARTLYRWIPGVLALVLLAPRVPCRAAVPQGVLKYYEVKIQLFSMQPDRMLDSYVSHGAGTATVNSTLQLACKDEWRDFSVRVQPHQQDGGLSAEVALTPDRTDTVTAGAAFQVDFPTLGPKALQLGQNADGRVYLLNLTPTVQIRDITPQRADETAFELNKWAFHNSIVVVNDSLYAGKMNASGGYKAYVDIGNVGKFEFALQPFRNAQLAGTLGDGTLHIETEDGTTLEIYDVRNGIHEMLLPGGPYAVWVRQSPSRRTEKDAIPPEARWREQVKGLYARMGRTLPSDEELHRKYEQLRSRGPSASIAFGIGPIPEADRIE
jgi:hypothetical protein